MTIGFARDGNALLWGMSHEFLRIEPWGQDSLRVRASPSQGSLDPPGALLDPAPGEARIEIGEEKATVRNGWIQAELSADGRFRFLRAPAGEVLLEEDWQRVPQYAGRLYKPVGGDLYRIEARFKPHEGERLYGLGQHPHGRLDQKGCVIDLEQRNTQVSIPFLLSSRGYGLLWHNPAVGRVELGHNGTRWVAEAARQMDYWITTGATPAEILAHYTEATGRSPLLPRWAAGFWQCKLRYATQDELLSVAREYKRRGLPLSVIVVDYFHWRMQGDWEFDPECWPDPSAMVRELEEMGVKLMVSIWPSVNADSSNFAEMVRRGLLVRTERGVQANLRFTDTRQPGRVYVHFYDPTNPEARGFIWEQVRANYYRHGIKVWWLDACEPEIAPVDHDNLRYHLGNGLEVGCLYPFLHQQAFYDGMRAEGESEIIMLCRSAWAGSQRYAAALWSGDIESTFAVLRAQVRAGLNVGLSGIPWWTTDIGGFYGGDPSSPSFRELVVRWFQYGTFCPLFRLHGVRSPAGDKTGGPNEVWSFGEEAYEIIKGLLFLRERLRPYIMEQMRTAHETGAPLMRPLFFDFPADQAGVEVEDQFMFGPDLLVAPVLHEGAREREVYLPAGTSWTDAWSGTKWEGGRWIKAVAPLSHVPLYVCGDRCLPIRA